MPEIIPRIGADRKVELTNDGSATLVGADPMTPQEAAFLARGILACAASISAPNAPPPGTLVGDVHLPIMRWATGTNPLGEAVLVLSILPGIELTFQMPPLTVRTLGEALISQAAGTAPPAGHSGTVH